MQKSKVCTASRMFFDKEPEIDISMIGIRYGEKMDLYPYWGQYFYFVIKYVCTNPMLNLPNKVYRS